MQANSNKLFRNSIQGLFHGEYSRTHQRLFYGALEGHLASSLTQHHINNDKFEWLIFSKAQICRVVGFSIVDASYIFIKALFLLYFSKFLLHYMERHAHNHKKSTIYL